MNSAFEPGLLSRLPSLPRKVAVVKPSRIGDLLCATPALRALRAALPAAEITLVTLPMLHDLALRSSQIDQVALFPGYPGLAEQLFDPRRAAAFFADMQAERFDLAIQIQGSGVYANPFTLMLGAKVTAGFIRPSDEPGLLDAALPLPDTGHEIERMLALITFLGAPPQGRRTEFPLWDKDHAAAEALLAGSKSPLIGLHPAARDQTRRWPLDRFAAAGAALQRRYGGTLVVLGEEEERETAATVVAAAGGRCLNLVGRTTLPALGAIIRRLTLFITNDSGPAHVAYALGAPTITIFGGGDPNRYGSPVSGPFRRLAASMPCRPCPGPTCLIGDACLHDVTVAEVVAAAEELLEGWSVRV